MTGTTLIGAGITPDYKCTAVKTISYLSTDEGGTTYPLGRHLDGANYAFADGHVKWLKGSGSPIAASSAVGNAWTTIALAGSSATFSNS